MLRNLYWLMVLAMTAMPMEAEAQQHGGIDCSDAPTASAVEHYAPKAAPRGAPLPPAQSVQCGATVTASTTLANDLLCPTLTGFALNIEGNNIVFNGNGHKIVAPNAAAGLFVQGNGVLITGLNVNGVLGGDGILAYDSPGIAINGNNFSGNQIGIMLYADNADLTGASITNNTATNNSLFGIRTGYAAPGAIVDPNIRGNNLGGSGSYGMLIKAADYEMDGLHGNSFAGSLNGLYLAGGNFYLHDFSLVNDGIQQIGIFADTRRLLITLSNLDLSTHLPADPLLQARIGADFYRAGNFTVQSVVAQQCDAGIKLETEDGYSPSGSISQSGFGGNSVAGILVVSYDGTPYGLLQFGYNCYAESSQALDVVLESGVVLGANSYLTKGGSCSLGRGQ